MTKKLPITNRELVRNWTRLKEKLRHGEANQLVVRDNGNAFVVTLRPEKKRPGDIRELLDRLEKMGPKKRVRLIRIPGTLSSLKLMERLSKKKKKI